MTPVMIFQLENLSRIWTEGRLIEFMPSGEREKITLRFKDEDEADTAWKRLQYGMTRGYGHITMNEAEVSVGRQETKSRRNL